MKSLAVKVLFVIVMFGWAATGLPQAYGAPDAELVDPRWERHDPTSLRRLDHSVWTRLLKAHVVEGEDGINRFAYGSFGATDLAELKAYLAGLERVRVADLNRNEQMAYWINLYNALTVQIVAEHYPVGSIRSIRLGGTFAQGPWGAKVAKVDRTALSLDDIEHGILRPIWRDARIHYAVNCASLGCPNIVPAAWRGDTLETMLEAAAKAYINHPRGVRVDTKGRVTASRLYRWYRADFEQSDGSVLGHLRRYAEGELAEQLATATKIRRYKYDWDLNDAR